MRTLALTSALIASAVMALPASARMDNLERIATRSLDRELQTSTVQVGDFFGRVTQVRVLALEGRVVVRDIIAKFGNGRSRDVFEPRRRRLDQGEAVTVRFRRPRLLRELEIDARAGRGNRGRGVFIVQVQPENRRIGPREFEPLQITELGRAQDRITLSIGSGEGRFSQLRLAGFGSQIRVRNAVVTYGNGRRERFDIGQRLRPGRDGPVLDLRGRNPRNVETVQLNIAGSRRAVARIAILGRERSNRRRPQRDTARVIGDRLADRRDDRIVIPVESRAGDVGAIRIRAKQNGLAIRRVIFERVRGRPVTVRFRQRIDAGERTNPIEVPEGRGRLDTVTLVVEPSRRRGTVLAELIALERIARPRRPQFPQARLRPPPRVSGDGLVSPYRRVMFEATRQRARLYEVDLRGRDRHEAMAIRAFRGNLRVRRIDVVYGNGQKEQIDLDFVLRRGQVSQAILFGQPRRLKSVSVLARTTDNSPRPARLGLFLASYEEPAPRRPRVERDGDWVLLGRQKAQMFSKDSDVFKVGRDYGRFDEIRVRAQRTDVRLFGMQIRFGNGTVEDVPLYGKLKKGRTTDPVELRTRGRFIESIALKYRSRLSLRGEGRVEVWGRLASRGRPAASNDEPRRRVRDLLREFRRKFQ